MKMFRNIDFKPIGIGLKAFGCMYFIGANLIFQIWNLQQGDPS